MTAPFKYRRPVLGAFLILAGILSIVVAIAAMLLGFGWEPTVGWGSW
jgi:hypothetical protein